MRGLVRLEVIKHLKGKKERKTQVGHNMISNGGLSAIAAKGIEDFLGGSSYFGGRSSIKTTMMVKYGIEVGYSGVQNMYGARTTNEQRCLSCALLGISAASYSNIDSRRGFLPLMDNTGAVGTDAVRAKASVKAVATNDRGISLPMNGTSFVDIARNGRKYGFPAGTGEGDVTGVAMVAATALNVGSVPWGGLRVSRRVDEISGFVDKVAGATSIVPPGIDGNGASVRMKFTTADSVTVHSRSLITGEQTDGTGTEWFPSSYQSVIPAYDDGRYIYQVLISSVVKCYRYDKQNSYSLSTFNIAGSSSSYYGNYKYYSFYDTGNGIDIWVMYNSSQRATVYHTASSSYEEFGTKAAIDTWVSTNYGMTIPSALSSDSNVVSYIPGTLGSNKVLFIGYGTYGDSYYKTMIEAWIFSNAASIVSSLIDIIQCLGADSRLWYVGNIYGVIEIGKALGGKLAEGSGSYSGYSSNGFPGSSGISIAPYGQDDYLYFVADYTGNEKYVESYEYGCYISMQGQWTNWMSVKALEETVTKSSETEVLVEYDYAFEGSSTTPVDPISNS